jgi:hypothetical protein
MPVEHYELSSVRSQLEMLTKRVDAIEVARLDELKARNERTAKRHERILWWYGTIMWVIGVAVWSAIITASVVGD